jgi:hypothetical protein
LKQEKHFLDAALRTGVTWFIQPDAGDSVGYFGQLFVNRIFFERLLIGVGFAFHSESSNGVKSTDDDAYSGAITGMVEWRILRLLAWTAEISASTFGYGSKYPSLSTALKFLTHRHAFSIIVSNTQYVNADGIVANAWRGFEDLIFGFQIIREFNL